MNSIRVSWPATGCVHIDAQHVAEPQIFADALMNHLFVNAAPAGVVVARSARKIFVTKFAPGADDFDSFGFVGFYQEVVSHHAS